MVGLAGTGAMGTPLWFFYIRINQHEPPLRDDSIWWARWGSNPIPKRGLARGEST